MKIVKINVSGQPLMIPSECYERAGCDVFFYVSTKSTPMELSLPSLKDEIKMRMWFKIFIFDNEKNAETNNITLKASGNEKINGASELVLKTNGAAVIIQPIGDSDWMCFTPAMPVEIKKKKKEEELQEPAEK